MAIRHDLQILPRLNILLKAMLVPSIDIYQAERPPCEYQHVFNRCRPPESGDFGLRSQAVSLRSNFELGDTLYHPPPETVV
jgi:hypothetical protein